MKASQPGFPGGEDTNAGWTAGGGLEFIIAGNWTAKAEYLYVDLGKFNCGLACGNGFNPDNVSFTHAPGARRRELPVLIKQQQQQQTKRLAPDRWSGAFHW